MRNRTTKIYPMTNYKSAGERTIEDFLLDARIKYEHEPGIIVNDRGYQRIWYPDFGIPEYAMFIEYFGMKNDNVYDNGTKHKLKTYKENLIDVIAIYPSTLKGNYQQHILNEIYRTSNNRLLSLEEKIYRFEHPANKTNRHHSYHRNSNGYRRF